MALLNVRATIYLAVAIRNFSFGKFISSAHNARSHFLLENYNSKFFEHVLFMQIWFVLSRTAALFSFQRKLLYSRRISSMLMNYILNSGLN